jgi:hypothetical protein
MAGLVRNILKANKKYLSTEKSKYIKPNVCWCNSPLSMISENPLNISILLYVTMVCEVTPKTRNFWTAITQPTSKIETKVTVLCAHWIGLLEAYFRSFFYFLSSAATVVKSCVR